jgi:hypothetical protein
MTAARSSKPIPLPAAVRRGGRQGWVAAALGGAVAGAVTLVVPVLLSSGAAFGFLAVWLGVTAGIYLGFALQDGRSSALGIEVVGVALFAALATVALDRDAAWPLAAGYFGHGLWDLVHHRRGIDTAMPWWVPGCLGYDAPPPPIGPTTAACWNAWGQVRAAAVGADGKFITSAGVSAGIDMALALSPACPTRPPPGWCSLRSSTTRTHRLAASTGAR